MMFEVLNGEPVIGREAILEKVVMYGVCDRVDRIDFDEDHVRFLEYWTLFGKRFMTSYDMIYSDVEEASSRGYIMPVRRVRITERVLCRYYNYEDPPYTPKEEWKVRGTFLDADSSCCCLDCYDIAGWDALVAGSAAATPDRDGNRDQDAGI